MNGRYVPNNAGELRDFLMSLLGGAPAYNDERYLGRRSVDSEFNILDESLGKIRIKLGEERYAEATRLSMQIRTLFKSDPEDKTGAAHQGCLLIWKIDELLKDPSGTANALG